MADPAPGLPEKQGGALWGWQVRDCGRRPKSSVQQWRGRAAGRVWQEWSVSRIKQKAHSLADSDTGAERTRGRDHRRNLSWGQVEFVKWVMGKETYLLDKTQKPTWVQQNGKGNTKRRYLKQESQLDNCHWIELTCSLNDPYPIVSVLHLVW